MVHLNRNLAYTFDGQLFLKNTCPKHFYIGNIKCTLAPCDLQDACRFKDKQGRQQKPDWRDAPDGKSYFPSYNIAPGAHTPVLLSSNHFQDCGSGGRVIQPMRWGLIPSWHKGSAGDKTYETNNCRAESMLEKMTYKVPLQKGRRCVILAEGFYEWKRGKDSKQPYYIYFPQYNNLSAIKSEVKVEVKVKQEVTTDESWVKQEVDDRLEDNEKSSLPRLLTMAGVFDVWKPPGESEPLYSYSVITVESSPSMSWIHHRMPAILSSDEEIEEWLNFGDVPLNKASKLIQPVTCIQSHPVSNVVNNSRNNTPECVKKTDPSKPKKSAGSTFMSAWLSKGTKVKSEGEPPEKKSKVS